MLPSVFTFHKSREYSQKRAPVSSSPPHHIIPHDKQIFFLSNTFSFDFFAVIWANVYSRVLMIPIVLSKRSTIYF